MRVRRGKTTRWGEVLPDACCHPSSTRASLGPAPTFAQYPGPAIRVMYTFNPCWRSVDEIQLAYTAPQTVPATSLPHDRPSSLRTIDNTSTPSSTLNKHPPTLHFSLSVSTTQPALLRLTLDADGQPTFRLTHGKAGPGVPPCSKRNAVLRPYTTQGSVKRS
ncbi:hypothetical protein D9619_008428 [Psilocybe cf. subviscida]|uniref:Uncharacterized protein n=1 Tax=Psilocybe cf. subviscida TaxID=2480587 RepID=A0A8H5F118_9AGAR|nr:hypothetical protein D9619_008428 [Psilocybe cf. subviscida]